MSAKTDVNRRVLAIQAKKKRHKPSKRKGKTNSQGEQDAQSSKGQRSGQATTTTATATTAAITTAAANNPNNTYEYPDLTPMQRSYARATR